MTSAPLSAAALRRVIDQAAARRSVAPGRLHYTVASTVVLQMVPSGVAKGGGAIRQRVSEHDARLTKDLDYSLEEDIDLDSFVDTFNQRLADGWHGFNGILKTMKKASPEGVPTEYVMDPFEVKLQYLDKPYGTVLLEVGHPETGSTDESVERLGSDIAEIFTEVGLPAPEPVRVMSAEHQITQKIHACTGPDAASRAHDLVDIQILAAVEDLDYTAIAAIGPRLFAYRQRHEWPPTVVAHDGWDGLYANACEDIVNNKVAGAVGEAIEMVNSIVERAVRSAR
jgi:Nucleotidyl transferase AbiEii toxin, Type IV TA system